jgi:succinyl-CoA synthetase alpha subunit
MRMAAEELAQHIMAAVNAALDDLATQEPVGNVPMVDSAVLAEQLREAQDQGIRQISLITEAISDAMTQIREGGR